MRGNETDAAAITSTAKRALLTRIHEQFACLHPLLRHSSAAGGDLGEMEFRSCVTWIARRAVRVARGALSRLRA